MFRDEFKSRYTTIPFAVYHAKYDHQKIESISHHHKEIEILTILDGNATFYIDSVSYDVEKGDLLIISPYSLHNAIITADKTFSHYCLCFDSGLMYDKKLSSDLENGDLFITPFISHNNIFSETLTQNIINAYLACQEKKPGWEFNAIGNISMFFGCLTENNLISSPQTNKKNKNFCMHVIDYINKNYENNITSTDISTELFMNNSYFCRLFKKNFGCCFQNYLNVYRLEKSTIILKTTDLSVSEISQQIGFNSISYYSKLFKEIYCCSPSEYRKGNCLK